MFSVTTRSPSSFFIILTNFETICPWGLPAKIKLGNNCLSFPSSFLLSLTKSETNSPRGLPAKIKLGNNICVISELFFIIITNCVTIRPRGRSPLSYFNRNIVSFFFFDSSLYSFNIAVVNHTNHNLCDFGVKLSSRTLFKFRKDIIFG